jgi:hypothetical protein
MHYRKSFRTECGIEMRRISWWEFYAILRDWLTARDFERAASMGLFVAGQWVEPSIAPVVVHTSVIGAIRESNIRYAARYTEPSEIWTLPSGFVAQRPAEEVASPLGRTPKWPESVLAWPTLERLAYKKDARRVVALLFWRDLTQPAAMLSGTIGDSTTNVETADIAEEGDLDAEVGIETRPTEPALLKAIGWKVTGKERWYHTDKLVRTYDTGNIRPVVKRHPTFGSHPVRGEIHFGDLRFRGNELTVWGWTKAGRPLKPVERPKDGKSSASTSRPMSKIREYLCLDRDPELPRSAVPRPGHSSGLERIPCSKAGAGAVSVIDKTPASAEAERTLAEAIANTKVMPAVTKCPPYVLPGKQWTGGIHRGRNDAPGAEAGPWEARSNVVAELARMASESKLRAALGDVAEILDDAISSSTAKTIAIKRGYAASSAEKYGAALIDKALDRLASFVEIPNKYFADNDNVKKEEKFAA